ncbi:MAG TPA: hypothetical protein ENJ00_02785 [Phycisphaerales bacterium]|nr:hypothetical protein [Phycisphaerales bacterium]
MIRVGWIFSLVRSGSSAASYAAASPWNLPVADELFGPWDRTGPPHNMPKRQAELARAFRAVGHTLTAEIVGLANDIIRELAERDTTGKGWVICKCPHLMFSPKDFQTWFGHAGSSGIRHYPAYLLRNPLRRVNSCYARQWEHMLNDPYELWVYLTFLGRWREAECRVRFEDMLAEPGRFFRTLYDGWGLIASHDEVDKAKDYLEQRYHDSSAEARPIESSRSILSESRWAAPREVLDAYLANDEIVSLLEEQNWPTSRLAYEGWAVPRLWRLLTRPRPGLAR